MPRNGRLHEPAPGPSRRFRRSAPAAVDPSASTFARTASREGEQADPAPLIERIRRSVIGDDAVIDGPFGPRRLVYADATARRIIHRAVNGSADDVVIFCGLGSTGAIDKLVRVLDLGAPRAERPVVFIGPYEDHSNELPWRECSADVVTIGEDAGGRIDIAELEDELRRYHPDPATREEGGMPAIVESIRAGLVFALKEAVGAEEIRRREDDFARRALASWGSNPQIEILGNPELERLAIVSLGVRHPRGLLHSNFVVAVLSDLFGIQARSGCFCAGPYIHRLYPIDDAWSAAMHAQARCGCLGATLAFARLSFNYYISEAVFDYLVEAVHLLANEGWKLLPHYRFDPRTGLWHHVNGRSRSLLRLRDLAFDSTGTDVALPTAPESVLARQLDEARRIIRAADAPPPLDPALSPEFERIRWFPLPGEAHAGR